MNIRAFRLSFKDYPFKRYSKSGFASELFTRRLLSLLVRNIRITGHVFDHVFGFRFLESFREKVSYS